MDAYLEERLTAFSGINAHASMNRITTMQQILCMFIWKSVTFNGPRSKDFDCNSGHVCLGESPIKHNRI